MCFLTSRGNEIPVTIRPTTVLRERGRPWRDDLTEVHRVRMSRFVPAQHAPGAARSAAWNRSGLGGCPPRRCAADALLQGGVGARGGVGQAPGGAVRWALRRARRTSTVFGAARVQSAAVCAGHQARCPEHAPTGSAMRHVRPPVSRRPGRPSPVPAGRTVRRRPVCPHGDGEDRRAVRGAGTKGPAALGPRPGRSGRRPVVPAPVSFVRCVRPVRGW